jgi:hypothetical protein
VTGSLLEHYKSEGRGAWGVVTWGRGGGTNGLERLTLEYCPTLRSPMSCPERATARRTGRIGFQPVSGQGARHPPKLCHLRRPRAQSASGGLRRQAGSLSYATVRCLEETADDENDDDDEDDSYRPAPTPPLRSVQAVPKIPKSG